MIVETIVIYKFQGRDYFDEFNLKNQNITRNLLAS